MACTNPIVSFPPNHTGPGFDKRYKILGNINSIGDRFMSHVNSDGQVIEPVYLPCGKCLSCRLAYSKKWADRIMAEVSMYSPSECWFITFTYDDMHLPFNSECIPTLDSEYFTRFLKRLRKKCGKFRFFMAGEYGTESYRPHYHVCFFGLKIDDLVFYKQTDNGDILYNSKTLSDLWGNGHVVIGSLTYESASYVARYCVKKAEGDFDEFFKEIGIEKEYIRMSRRPGIGFEYLSNHIDELIDDPYLYISGRVSELPRYFITKIDEVDHISAEKIKAKRRLYGSIRSDTSLAVTNLSKIDLNDVRDRQLHKKIKALRREI